MKRITTIIISIVGILFIGLVACQRETAVAPTPTPEPVAEARELNFYNWDTYIDPQIITDFEQQFGVTVNYQIFDSDSDMVDELMNGATAAYDLVVPSDYNVAVLRSENLLAPLDRNNIPNFSNIDAQFLSPAFDPGNRFCVPYQWGTVGIGYNTEAIEAPVTSWADFFDPAYAGRIAVMDDARTMMGIALLNLGFSPNSTQPNEINQATGFLAEQADKVAFVHDDDGQDLLLNGDVDLVIEWSGDIFQLMEENDNINYVIPTEGAILWVDNMCIPIDAPNKELAEMLINYLLEPEVGAALSNYIQYATPNEMALPLVDDIYRNNPAIYPTDQVRERLFLLVDVDNQTRDLYDGEWETLLTTFGQ